MLHKIPPCRKGPIRGEKTTAIEKAGYKILGSLGEGGQARVYEVQKSAEADGPTYALKVLKSEKGKKAYERFHREIKVLKGLVDHPGIVKIYDDAEADGFHFYLMEYLDGYKPLRKIVNTDRSPFHRNPELSLNVYMQILRALVVCEQNNLVHRDLSLLNVLVDTAIDVKLIDFSCCHIDDTECVTLTEADEAVGTPLYRAPGAKDRATQSRRSGQTCIPQARFSGPWSRTERRSLGKDRSSPTWHLITSWPTAR